MELIFWTKHCLISHLFITGSFLFYILYLISYLHVLSLLKFVHKLYAKILVYPIYYKCKSLWVRMLVTYFSHKNYWSDRDEIRNRDRLWTEITYRLYFLFHENVGEVAAKSYYNTIVLKNTKALQLFFIV